MSKAFVYILSSRRDGVIYIGVTSDLIKRIWEHKNSFVDGFSKRYGVKTLVYYEEHISIEDAILREKQVKKWRRQWKVELIESVNAGWNDLYQGLL